MLTFPHLGLYVMVYIYSCETDTGSVCGTAKASIMTLCFKAFSPMCSSLIHYHSFSEEIIGATGVCLFGCLVVVGLVVVVVQYVNLSTNVRNVSHFLFF